MKKAERVPPRTPRVGVLRAGDAPLTLRCPGGSGPPGPRRPLDLAPRPVLDVLRRRYGTLLIDVLGGRRVP
jgi:hypothetical protein